MNWIKITTPVTLACFLFYTLLVPCVAYADTPPADTDDLERITTLRLGDPAPFAGTLFSTRAAAKLMVDLKFTQETCGLEIDRRLGILSAGMQLKLDICQGRYESLNTKHTSLMAIRADQISFLESKIKSPPWYESGEFWFAMGVVGGILITVGAGYAIGQASK
jgi:hypothetical protein